MKVSVIMSVYNTKKSFLEESINSILNQTFGDFEFIIINDSSNQETDLILKQFNDSRIIFVENEQNYGLTANLNTAIKQARGEYIARMDADDISLPMRFEKQVKFLDENPEVGVLGTSAIIIGSRKRIETPYLNHNDIKARLLINNTMIHPSVMMRKSLLEKNYYDEKFRIGQDYELWSRLIWETNFSNLPEKLLRYRAHSNQITTTKKDQQDSTANVVRTRMLKKVISEMDPSKIDLINKASNTIPLNKDELVELRDISIQILKENEKKGLFSDKSLITILSENLDMALYINAREKKGWPIDSIRLKPKHITNKYTFLKYLGLFYGPMKKIFG